MSLERPHSRASSGSRGPPPTPPPTYLWEEVRRSKSRGGYPWTILYKPPLPDNLDIELLLKGEISNERFVDEKFRGRSAYGTDKRSQIRNRLRDRERSRRAKSEPTPSLPSSSTVSLSAAMDQAMAVDPSVQSDELEDFPLPDEDIPDFVMAYLQSDKGNLDEDIPDHILEYIQSRAAILEKNQLQAKQTDDDIFYTKEELRIIDQARKRLEEQGELDVDPSATIDEDMNAFDHFFQRTAAGQDSSVVTFQEKSDQMKLKEVKQPEEHEPANKKSKNKGGKFNFSNISIPNKTQLNIKLPKFGPGRKKVKDTNNTELDQQEPVESVVEVGKQTKPRRPHSSSPMRQKINQQLESWNNSLKKFKTSRSGRNNDGQIKSFVALLPGRSSKATKLKEPENQYEEVGPPRSDSGSRQTAVCNPPALDNSVLKATVDSAEEKARLSPSHENNEAEETMDDIENLPESEEAEVIKGDGIVVDREVADVIVTRGEFVDIDIDEEFENNEEAMDGPTEIEQVAGDDKTTVAESTGFAARSRKAFELTKSKIQTSLSKEQLQATRNKLQSTLSKQNLQATRKKVQSTLSKRNLQATRDKLQSTLSKENFQATRNKLQTSLNTTLKRKKSKNQEPTPQSVPQDNIFPTFPQGDEREYETSTPVERKTNDWIVPNDNKMPEELPVDSNPPTVKQRAKHRETIIKPVENLPVQLTHGNECENIEEETEEDLEDELEPKLEFSIHGSDRPQPSSVSQSTETLPDDEAESDKENVVVRPKRQRYRNRRHGFHEEFGRPQSAHAESNIRSSWVEKTNTYPTISQEMLSAFCAPVNSLEAVDNSWGSGRKPDRPVRSRSKKDLNLPSDDHFYSNVPPRRNKRGKKKSPIESPNEDNYVKTWPRKGLPTEKPVVPKRCRSKVTKKPLFSVCSNYQTWPRRSMVHSPPTAPKRTRSRRKINEDDVSDMRDLEGQIENCTSNILIDADTLFGAESRFIDEDGADLDRTQSLQDEQIVTTENCKLNYNIPGELPHANENKILNNNKSPKPLAPNRRKNNQTGSLRKPKHSPTADYSEATWPRISRTLPSAPQRRKPSMKKTEKTEAVVHLDLEKPSKKLPTVPASTPSEDHETNEHGDGESASSVQADLDQILEILASTFPQEANPQENTEIDKKEEPATEEATNNAIVQDTEDIFDENPYAEIKQFQKRTPPPRPPPPIYAPASTSSYSYIYTIPRRKKGISNSNSPERPPRTYCTIRPHRPPRRHRLDTPNELVFQSEDHSELSLARRHSFSGGDDAKEERDLQSAPIVERMRARPLPAPPRIKRQRSRSPPHKPPRSRTSSLKRHNPQQLSDICIPNEEVAEPRLENPANQLASNVDEYEPIENPAQVEEISVGIQTDPLPEYDESVIIAEPNEMQLDGTQNVEINNNLYEQREEVNGPANERLALEQVLVEPPSLPSLEPSILNEHEDNSCSQIIWSAANSPDPDPIPESKSISESDLIRSPIPEPITPTHLHEDQQATQVKETTNKRKTSNTLSRNGEDDEVDSFSQIPPHFHRSIAPLPPINIDFPTRLQLSDLDVERLNVREVMAERLIVSSVDTNSLQVCQMTTTNASGQLMFNIGPGVTIPLLTNHRETEDVGIDRHSAQTSPSLPADVQTLPDTSVNRQDERKPSTSTALEKLETPSTQEIVLQQEEPTILTETPSQSCGNAKASMAHSSDETGTGGDRTTRQTEVVNNPSVSDLAMQLANLSARNILSGVCVAATETYSMAQRVAELGLQQFSDHLQRRGIQFDDKEKEDLKAVLLMLLIVVCAIFLLGMGKQRISNHWDFYFPN